MGRTEKYEAKNWKELTERQLNKLTPVERSRYMAVSCCSCPTHCDLGNAIAVSQKAHTVHVACAVVLVVVFACMKNIRTCCLLVISCVPMYDCSGADWEMGASCIACQTTATWWPCMYTQLEDSYYWAQHSVVCVSVSLSLSLSLCSTSQCPKTPRRGSWRP